MTPEFVVEKKIAGFREVPGIAAQSETTVLLLRHSIRYSLQNGGFDPELTPEGKEFAFQCGKLLSGLENVSFASSFLRRAVQTAQEIAKGGDFPVSEITGVPEISDTALFTRPENLHNALTDGSISPMLNEYYSAGKCEGMVDREVFAVMLAKYLTSLEGGRNWILTTHDIIVSALLTFFDVYPLDPARDWCGYVQGAFLYRQNGVWHIAYIVPEPEKREIFQLYV